MKLGTLHQSYGCYVVDFKSRNLFGIDNSMKKMDSIKAPPHVAIIATSSVDVVIIGYI